jgi:DNA end-binding protein Ku
MWNGSISFGLVNVPVKLYNAVSRKGVSFNQVDSKTGSRVRMQRVASADGHEVPYEDIVKGYEVAPDQFVLIEQAELDALDPEATRTIDIEEFVDLADIDPVFYDTAYIVAPGSGAAKPYALLVRAMEEEGKVALARVVLRTKQYLAAVRAADGHLVMSTMVYADELVDPGEIGDLKGTAAVDVSERELTMARQLVTSLSSPFEPERFRDEYRERVLALIEEKAAGREVVVEAAAPEQTKVVDLMAALEASVAEARSARSRHPTARDADAAARGRAAAEPAADIDLADAPVALDEAAAGAPPARGGRGAKKKAAAAAAPKRARKSA